MNQQYYGEKYYAEYSGIDYKNRKIWKETFGRIAKRIIADFAPKTVLDMGCAFGYLVECLREEGVEAYGIDFSEYAISNAHESIKPFVAVASIADPLPENFPEKYDLVVSIEVIEHVLESEGLKALKNMTSYSDMVMISSSYSDTSDPSHINLHTPDYWAEKMAENGFVKDLDYNGDYICKENFLYKKRKIKSMEILSMYEKKVFEQARYIEKIQKIIANSGLRYLKEASLFFDTGSGFTESQQMTVVPEQGEVPDCYTAKFDIEAKDFISLRFDPLDGYFCKIKILKITTEGAEVEIENTNASYFVDNEYTFETVDPSFYFTGDFAGLKSIAIDYQVLGYDIVSKVNRLKAKNKEIVVETRSLTAETRAQKNVIVANKIELDELKDDVRNMFSEIKYLEKDKRKLEEGVTELRDAIKEMKNSKSWKITKPLRALSGRKNK